MRLLHRSTTLLSALVLACIVSAQTKIQPLSPANPNQTASFQVFLPSQNSSQLDQLLADLGDSGSPNYRRWITPQEFRLRFGANGSDLAGVSSALTSLGLQVLQTHAHGVQVQGKVSAIQKAFGVTLYNAVTPNGTPTLIANQALKLPNTLKQANAGVAAFSPRIRRHTHGRRTNASPANRYSPVGPYWFDDLKQAYDFPSFLNLTGAGRTIGILMANDFLDSDMNAYFGHEKLATPRILRAPVDGGAPFDPDLSFETELDIQQSGGMAPKATIIHYNIPDLSDQAVMDGYLQIIQENRVDIVNSSFGGAEGFYTAAYNDGVDYTFLLRKMDDLFRQGNAQGITFVASSGDNGALGLPPLSYFNPPQNPPVITGHYLVGVEEPASSPHVTAVGGTNLVTASTPGSLDSSYVRENANGDPLAPEDPYGVGNLVSGGYWGSGGGVSTVFSKPLYQYLVNTGTNMRAIPDVSLHMGGCPVGTLGTCPTDRSSDVVVLAGGLYAVVGTSASAPDFAGVLALAEQNLGGIRLGNANYLIYAMAAAQSFGFVRAFHQGIPGYNGFYTSQQNVPGYNMVVGNGTLYVRPFILAPFVPAAGVPQTPSNP